MERTTQQQQQKKKRKNDKSKLSLFKLNEVLQT